MGRWAGREHRKIANEILPRRDAGIARLIARAAFERPAHKGHAAASTRSIVSGDPTVPQLRPAPWGTSLAGDGMFSAVPMGYGDGIASNLEDIARGRHSFSNGRAASVFRTRRNWRNQSDWYRKEDRRRTRLRLHHRRGWTGIFLPSQWTRQFTDVRESRGR